MHACVLSCVQLFVTPWTITHQDSLSMEFSGKNIGVGCHAFLQNLPDPWIEPESSTCQADSLPSEPRGKPCHLM